MFDHRQLHFAALHQPGVLTQLINRLRRQIAAPQQDEGKVFSECGIGRRPGQHFRRRAVNGFRKRHRKPDCQTGVGPGWMFRRHSVVALVALRDNSRNSFP